MLFQDKMAYSGSFFRGKKHGVGTLANDQFSYVGQFNLDFIDGVGHYSEKHKDGDEYLGNWEAGKYSGFGYLKEKDEKGQVWEYIGEFKDGMKHGYGLVFYPSKAIFEGYFW
mmetsp:Transcript_24572/g.24171  ORF Transcript_24572/g.24171 Transcript_24572/m.24171 type:complete len:112 (+) Transcript_24572:594-929(+)